MNTEDDEFARIAREQALNKKAENARELGLDYELPITMQAGELDCTHAERLCAELKMAEQPAQQEPVEFKCIVIDNHHSNGIPFEQWVKPAQRTWVGLTDEEQQELYDQWQDDGWGSFCSAIEAKLQEKNYD